jgi:sigma-B regulation protein RsbU (phosphoserine phosphatase)
VLRAVEAFVGNAPQFDDITMLTLRFDQASMDADAPMEARPRLMLTGFPATGGDDMDGGATAKPGQDSVAPAPAAAAPAPGPVPVPAPIAMDPDRVAMLIANDVAELERLAELVDMFIEKHGLPEKLAFNLNVCLDELITNIISYGYDDEDAHEIQVEFIYDGREFVTRIVDDAKEYDPFTEAPIPDLDLDVEDRPIGGLGVFLVKEFMDGTEYAHEGGRNTTTLRKTISA